MSKVKVRFTGTREDIAYLVWKMSFNFVIGDSPIALNEVSAFYPDRGQTNIGRVYADLHFETDDLDWSTKDAEEE